MGRGRLIWLQTTQPTSGGAVTTNSSCCANCVEPPRPQQWGPDLPFFWASRPCGPAGWLCQMDGEAGWWTTSGNIGLPPLARVMGVGRQQQVDCWVLCEPSCCLLLYWQMRCEVFLLLTLLVTCTQWLLNEKKVPNTLLVSGDCGPGKVLSRRSWSSCGSGVNKVTDDFGADIKS